MRRRSILIIALFVLPLLVHAHDRYSTSCLVMRLGLNSGQVVKIKNIYATSNVKLSNILGNPNVNEKTLIKNLAKENVSLSNSALNHKQRKKLEKLRKNATSNMFRHLSKRKLNMDDITRLKVNVDTKIRLKDLYNSYINKMNEIKAGQLSKNTKQERLKVLKEDFKSDIQSILDVSSLCE